MSTTTITRIDQDIQREVLDELAWEPRVQPHEIGVAVQEGIVALTGFVDSYGKKWAAERAAHRVRRVRAVANDIEVRLPTSAARSDPEIAQAATRSLEWDAFVPIGDIDVTVADGWVTLRGEVEWEYQRRAADRAVRRLNGVRGVSNGITVRPQQEPARELEQQITAALVRNVEADTQRITVQVRGDTVFLSGLVSSWREREEAERVVWSSPGISEVHNHIVVRL